MIRPPSSYPLIVSVGNKMTDWLAHEMHYFLHLGGSRVLHACSLQLAGRSSIALGPSIIFGDVSNEPRLLFQTQMDTDFCSKNTRRKNILVLTTVLIDFQHVSSCFHRGDARVKVGNRFKKYRERLYYRVWNRDICNEFFLRTCC